MPKHLLAAIIAALALRLFLIWRYAMVAPDSLLYEELARNWLDYAVYGVFIGDHVMPVDMRVPGYPAFLAAVYAVFGRTRLAVLLAQAVVDLATCFLTALLAARLAPGADRQRVARVALWLAALCPFTANYTAVPLAEVLAAFLTMLALVLLLDAYRSTEGLADAGRPSGDATKLWFLAGVVVGLGALVRPETPLLLAGVALVVMIRWRRPRHWSRLARAGALSTAALLFALLPWAARNWHTLGRVQFLAPRYAELPGEFVPRGFYAWTKTWLVRFGDVYLTIWKLGDERIEISSVYARAFDSPEERERVAGLLDRYNQRHDLSPELDNEFAELARERTGRHPLRTYLWIPLERAATLWFTPRIELLPYSGQLWPPGEKWEEDSVDFLVASGFGLLNFLYIGLALAAAWRFRREPAVHLLISWLLVRTAFLTQIETPEPRYTVVAIPAVLALAALHWARPQAMPAEHVSKNS